MPGPASATVISTNGPLECRDFWVTCVNRPRKPAIAPRRADRKLDIETTINNYQFKNLAVDPVATSEYQKIWYPPILVLFKLVRRPEPIRAGARRERQAVVSLRFACWH